MFLSTTLDPIVALVSLMAILIILLGLFLRKIKQPYIIGYILVGAFLGEHGMGFIKDAETIKHLGEIGIILLLFFIGMEISLLELVKKWKIAAIGTTLQVIISVLVLMGIGYFLNWKIERSIIMGFVISLSSSAIIIKLLEDKNLINSKIGKNVLSILLTQDIIVVPLLIIASLLGGEPEPIESILLMSVGGVLIILTLFYLYKKREIKLPFSDKIKKDHELQVFLAILMCFGGALLASLFGLSPALGAFIGGMVMHSAKSTDWIHNTLHSFRVLFVAFFFISVGLQINFMFIYNNMITIAEVLIAVYIINHIINAVILKLFSCTWKEALVGGALLSQIGELSFLLSFSAYSMNVIGNYAYNFTISLISLTLIISPFYIGLTEKLTQRKSEKTIE
ncbi:cation:proton antiporter domain-containing protein [Aquimarina agarilytica]|uniref:cation:proton antiporter domain-containing protein n=1 Tax=Aquimarina agarilytica TaxID=1087449 RepID=UPI000288610B|nr:cation:proton antiporter [Aquimarina agarilytica]